MPKQLPFFQLFFSFFQLFFNFFSSFRDRNLTFIHRYRYCAMHCAVRPALCTAPSPTLQHPPTTSATCDWSFCSICCIYVVINQIMILNTRHIYFIYILECFLKVLGTLGENVILTAAHQYQGAPQCIISVLIFSSLCSS